MSLWDTITGAGRKNASAEQLKRAVKGKTKGRYI